MAERTREMRRFGQQAFTSNEILIVVPVVEGLRIDHELASQLHKEAIELTKNSKEHSGIVDRSCQLLKSLNAFPT